MKVEQVRKLSKIEQLCWFVREREEVRLKKLAGEPKPWSTNEVLQSYRFTCPRRMDDKVSIWLLENWYKPYFGHKHIVAAISLARHINKPESLEAIESVVFPKWKPDRIKEILRKIKASGKTVFNSAYMVRGNNGEDKISSVVDYTVQPIIDHPPFIYNDSMKNTWHEILRYFGHGSFMTGQIVADLRWAIYGGWLDKCDWAPMGPGSRRGMNRLHDRNLNWNLKQDQFLEELLELKEIYAKELPKELYERTEAIDWQNTLCEMDKVWRVMSGEGRPKQLYQGFGDE